MIRFIDVNRDRFGVELICRVLRDAAWGFLASLAAIAPRRPA